jgi:ADP-heptose:LPS heptosyltransferase
LVKFLVIRFSSIGDIVLTTPVIRCLKNQVEGAEVHFVTKKQFDPIVKDNPYIDKIHLLDGSIKELTNKLKEEHFDYIIDLHHNLRTSIIKSKLRLISFSFNKLNFQKWLMVAFKINRLPTEHIVERYMATTKLFGVINDNKGLNYYIPVENEVSLQNLPENFRKGYVALVIGAKHATKRMTDDKIVSLCKMLHYPVILLGGNEDAASGAVIAEACGQGVFNSCGMYSLNQSASLVKQANVVISHDTGLMHIAAAFKKKIISIWGNTIPEFGMYPYQPDEASQIFEVKGLKCRPCSKIGYDKCPQKHFRCMNDIKEDEIATVVHRILL